MNTVNFKRLFFAALIFSLTLPTWAQDFDDDSPFGEPYPQTTQFGISPFYGYRFGGEVEDENTDTTYSFKDSPAYGVVLDYSPPGYFGRFELLWSHQESSLDFDGNNGLDEVDVTIDVIQMGGIAEFGTKRFREYISMHVGATHFSSDGFDDDTRLSFGIGGGVKVFLTKNIYLRADFRAFCTIVEAEGSFISANGTTVAVFTGDTFWQGQVSAGIGITF